MYSKVKDESLKANQRFVDSLSSAELEDLMCEFDEYEIEENHYSFNTPESFNDYLYQKYKKFKLFEKFDIQERKSVNIEYDIIKKNPQKVLFSF